MSYKDTNITNPGTSIKYGADDMEVIARLLNGVTSGPFAVTIKSSNKWGFWDAKAYFRNQADTFNTTIRGAVTQTNNWDLALPNLTANDTIAAAGVTNVWAAKQQLEAGTLMKQMSSPSNPASTYHHLFVNTSGQLVKRDSSGNEVLYTSSLSAGDVSPLHDYSARVFNNAGTYYAYSSSGALITSGTVFETVAQAALNLKGSVLFSGPTTLACSASFAGLDIPDKTHLIIERGCTVTVPNAYTGYFLRALNVDKWIIECNGIIDEAGTPARNWNCFFLDSTTVMISDAHIIHAHVYNASTVIRMRATGATAFIEGNEFMNVTGRDCRKFVTWEEASSGSIDMNMFMSCVIDALAGVTTNGFKDVTGSMNELHGCMFMDNNGSMSEFNILNTADNTMIVGGNLGMMGMGTFTDSSLSTTYLNAGLGLQVDSGYLKVRNPAGSFYTNIQNSATTVNKTFILPDTTTTNTATFAMLEQNQSYSQTQEIMVDNSFPLQLSRPINTLNTTWGTEYWAKDTSNAWNLYASIRAAIFDNTNNSEDGMLRFYTQIAGVLGNTMTIDQVGALLCGGPNTRIRFIETGLTGVRTYTLPDADTSLIGLAAANTFTNLLTIQRDAASSFIDMYRTDNAAGNTLDLGFYLDSSTNVKRNYGRIECEIDDPTNTSEDSHFNVKNMWAGTLQLAQKMYGDGSADFIHRANTVNDEWGFTFIGLDSTSAVQNYGTFYSKIITNTTAAEDGEFRMNQVNAGSIVNTHKFQNNGRILVGRDGVNFRGVSTYYNTSSNDAVFNTSSSENTLFTFTIKGNTMGVDGHAILKMGGYILQNQATGTTYTFRIKIGGTTVWQDTLGGTIAQSATKRPWFAEIRFYPANQSTTSARMTGFMILNDTTAPTTGQGSTADATIGALGAIRAEAASWTFSSDTTVLVSCQMSVNNSATEIMMDNATLEYAPS